MTTCDCCNKRLTRLSSINEKVNTCHDCESAIRDEDCEQSIKGGNDSKYNGYITDDAKISTPNSKTSSIVSLISNRVCSIPGFQLAKSEINTDFKDALLASLYICDLYYHLQPMIERKPDGIILTIGTNDAVDKDHMRF